MVVSCGNLKIDDIMIGTKWQYGAYLGRSRCDLWRYGPLGRRHVHGSHSNNVALTPLAEVDVTNPSSSNGGVDQEDRLAAMIRPYFQQQTPLVLRHAMSEVPAIQRWPQFLSLWPQELPVHQMGAVEIGGTYSTADRAEIPIHDFLQYLQFFEERHGRYGSKDPWESPYTSPSTSNSTTTTINPQELVYMAQNDLPLPLYKDIVIPKFCQEETFGVGHGRLYSVMMWVGPRGCKSPLHFDPLDNILMQMVGRKVVWMFDPRHGEKDKEGGGGSGMWHYAGHGNQQSNTSPVNPENVDTSRYPRFLEHGPPARRCVLEPGDVLYIPSKWWHYVRSVDTSISVNVWWR